ncbi:MAG: NlpC/P60 family protein [Filomicrobium sp.]
MGQTALRSAVSTRADTVVRAAREWIGTPYHHQASRKGIGTDCLGLVRGVWRDVCGDEPQAPPPYSRDWTVGGETLLAAARHHFDEVPATEATPGDVLVFRYRPNLPAKHCGVLVTPTRFIHATEGAAVSEVPFSNWWRRRVAGVFRFPNEGR